MGPAHGALTRPGGVGYSAPMPTPHYIIAAVLLSSCAAPTQQQLKNYRTAQGLLVSTYGGAKVDVDQLEAVTEAFIEHTEDQFGDAARGTLDNYTVYFVASGFMCGKVPVQGGCHIRNIKTILVVLRKACLADTSYVHELTHALEWHLTGSSNSAHSDPLFWSTRWGVVAEVNRKVRGHCRESPGFFK